MTRFYNSVKRKVVETRIKTKSLQKNFLGLTSVLVLGFLSGNLFGTVLSFVRKFIVWDGWIVASLIITGELISYISYKPRFATTSAAKEFKVDKQNLLEKKSNKKFVFATYKAKLCNTFGEKKLEASLLKTNRLNVLRSFFNFFKIGVLIGFFVDAFKVGS